MSHAKVFYLTDNKKGATIAGEVIEVTDRWVTIIPDDESVTKMLIPYSRGPIVEYCPHPDEAECRLTDKTIGQWCDHCSMRRTFVNDVCSSCGTKWLDQEGLKQELEWVCLKKGKRASWHCINGSAADFLNLGVTLCGEAAMSSSTIVAGGRSAPPDREPTCTKCLKKVGGR